MGRVPLLILVVHALACGLVGACGPVGASRPTVMNTHFRAAVVDYPGDDPRDIGWPVASPSQQSLILIAWDFEVKHTKPGAIYSVGTTYCPAISFTGVVSKSGHVRGEALCHGSTGGAETGNFLGAISGPGIENFTYDTLKKTPLEPPWHSFGRGEGNLSPLQVPRFERGGPRACKTFHFDKLEAVANLSTGRLRLSSNPVPETRENETPSHLARQIYLPQERLLLGGDTFHSINATYDQDWLTHFERRLNWNGAQAQSFAYVFGFSSERSATCDIATTPVQIET